MSILNAVIKTATASLNIPSNVVIAGNHQTINAGGDNVLLTAGNNDTITIGSDGTLIAGNNDIITAGSGDRLLIGNNDSVTMGSGYLAAADNDVITLVTGSTLTIGALGNNDVINAGGLSAAGAALTGSASLTFGAYEHATLNGTGDTIIGAQGDYIAFGGRAGSLGGAAPTKISDTVGAGTTGITVSSGLGVDTIAGGVGYEGGNTYIGSYHDDADGAAGIGSCINYSDLGLTAADAGLHTTIDLAKGIAIGYDADGNTLWTDSLVDMQQAKAANGNGDVLISSDSYYSELKGAGGTTTYYCGDQGTSVFWGWNTQVGDDIAYGNAAAADDYVWRISAADPNGNDPTRPASVLGQLIYNFDADQTGTFNLDKGDRLDFSQVNQAWSGLSNFANWSVQSDGKGGTDLVVQGLGTVIDLGNTSLSSGQLVQLYNSGHLIV